MFSAFIKFKILGALLEGIVRRVGYLTVSFSFLGHKLWSMRFIPFLIPRFDKREIRSFSIRKNLLKKLIDPLDGSHIVLVKAKDPERLDHRKKSWKSQTFITNSATPLPRRATSCGDCRFICEVQQVCTIGSIYAKFWMQMCRRQWTFAFTIKFCMLIGCTWNWARWIRTKSIHQKMCFWTCWWMFST